MIRIISLVLLSGLMSLFFVSPVWAEPNLVFTVSSMSEFEIGQYPFFNGTAVDSNGNPLSNVKIQAHFQSTIIMTSTNSTGEFSITSSIPAELGQYTIPIYAKMDNLIAKALVTYQVIENKPIVVPLEILEEAKEEVIKSVKVVPETIVDSEIKLDPFSIMLLQIKEQKVIEEKKIILSKQQEYIIEQRRIALDALEEDLKSFKKQQESNSLKNSFLRFIANIDSSFKEIFWQQFLFLEKITTEAREAKENALEEGYSSIEATKIFQHKAAVSQNEITEYLKNLNIKYRNATSIVQEQFNEEGKILREE